MSPVFFKVSFTFDVVLILRLFFPTWACKIFDRLDVDRCHNRQNIEIFSGKVKFYFIVVIGTTS